MRTGIQAETLKVCSVEEFGEWWDKYFHASTVVQLGNSPVRLKRERMLIAGGQSSGLNYRPIS